LIGGATQIISNGLRKCGLMRAIGTKPKIANFAGKSILYFYTYAAWVQAAP